MAKKKLKTTLDKQLKIYSAMAAGVLALAPSVEAAIHYSGLKFLTVNPTTPQYVDFSGDAPNNLQADFKFSYSKWSYWSNGKFYWGKGPYFIGRNGAGQIWGGPAYCSDAIRLASNYQVGPTLANQNFQWVGNYWDSLNGTYLGIEGNCQGNFNHATGFLGVRFHTAGCQGSNYNYGWIQYRGDTVSSGTIIDWEYEDTCNTPIAAGANYHTYTSSSVVNCNGNDPCFAKIQDAIASATAPAESKITQETYIEDINLDSDLWVVLRGGWDQNFESNSSSFTTIEGVMTITNGMVIPENIILK